MAIEPSSQDESPRIPSMTNPTTDQTNQTMQSTLGPAPLAGAVDCINTNTKPVSTETIPEPISSEVNPTLISTEITTPPTPTGASGYHQTSTTPERTTNEDPSDDESDTEQIHKHKPLEPALALQWNLCGLSARSAELELLKNRLNPVVIALQEVQTRQARQKLNDSGYEWEFCYPPGEVSKNGAALGIQKGIPHEFVQLDTSLQAVAATVEWPIRATFVSLYICKKDGRRSLQAELEKIRDQLPSPIVMLGDFNAHSDLWGSVKLDDRGRAVEEFISNGNLIVLNNGSHTRVDPHDGGTSAIDLSIASDSLARRLRWEILDDSHGSDHLPIVIRDTERRTKPELKRQRWKYDDADWKSFGEVLIPPDTVSVETFETTIIAAAKTYIPETSTKVSRRAVPWWNGTVAEVIKRRRKALRRLRKLKPGDPRQAEALKAFRIVRNECLEATKTAKSQSWTRFVTGISPALNSRENWRRINLFRNGNGSSTTVKRLETPDGFTDDPAEMANILADQFHRVSADASLHPEHIQKRTETRSAVDHTKHDDKPYNVDFSLAELRWAISRGKGLSDGVDRIGYPMLSHLPEAMEKYLLKVLNQVWRTGRIPARWKEGLVVPIPKTNKDPTQPANLRPITLVSCVGKTLERMVNRRLIQLLEDLGVFGSRQHGFRSGHGVETYLADLEEELEAAIQKGQHTELVLLDLAKAYDTAWRAPIVTSLAKWGIGGNMGRYIENFLNDRTFRVVIGNTLSTTQTLENGVPQGTVIAVTAFLIRMTEVEAFVPAGVEIKLYADDILLSATGCKAGVVRDKLQKAVEAVEAWAILYGFRLSAPKSELLHICRKNRHLDRPDIQTEEGPIVTAKSARLLGVSLDSRLRLWKHIENTRRSIANNNRILSVLGGHLTAGARSTLLTAQQALVQSKIFFGWGLVSSAADSRRGRLEAGYNAGIRSASGAFKSSPVLSIMAEAGTLPFKYAETMALVNKGTQIQSLSNPTVTRKVFERARERFGTLTHHELPNIAPVLRASDRPWNAPVPTIDWTVHSLVRAGDNSAKVTAAFAETAGRYKTCRMIFTDGSLKDGVVGSGIVDGPTRITHRLPEQCSVFSAEAYAILKCLESTSESSRRTAIFSDSLSVLAAVESGTSKHPWVQQIEMELPKRNAVLVWIPGHAGIAGNEAADECAKAAHLAEPVEIPVPKQDATRWAREKVAWTWDREWYNYRDSQLRRIKPTTAPGVDRTDQEEQRALTRLRIGHTRLTHGDQFKTGAKTCETCGTPQTVVHVLLDCRKYTEARIKHAIDPNLGVALANTPTEETKILAFLREAGIFKEL